MKQSKYSSKLDESKLTYYKLLMSGYNSYQNKDLQSALRFYQEAERISSDTVSSPLVKSIMGVIHMQNCNYTEAITCFDAGLKQLRASQFKKSSSLDIEYETSAVAIKLRGNLALCYLVLGQYNESIEQVENCLNIIRKSQGKNVRNLYESLVYIFYRFHNFQVMRKADFDSLETKYDDYSQACFYSTMAINKELCQQPESSYKLHKKALEIWTVRKEAGYMLITVRHLLALAKQLKVGKKTIEEYERQIFNLTNSQELEGIPEKTLVKGFNEKMKCAKTITTMLIQFEEDSLKYGDTQEVQLKDWKIATKLKLQKAIRTAEADLKTADSKIRGQMQLAIDQIKQTLLSLESESNVLIQRNLQKSNFVIQAVNSFSGLKSLLTRLGHIIHRHSKQNMKRALQAIQETPQKSPPPPQQRFPSKVDTSPKGAPIYSSNYNQPTNKSSLKKPPSYQSEVPKASELKNQKMSSIQEWQQGKPPSSVKVPSSRITDKNKSRYHKVLQLARRIRAMFELEERNRLRVQKKMQQYQRWCQKGEYLLKRNFTSDGGEEKFVQLTKTDIRWAEDQNKINKKNNFHFFTINEVRDIIYGKDSVTFQKSCNKSYMPWRCFSVVTQNRTLDLCSESDLDVKFWILGLSHGIKKIKEKEVDKEIDNEKQVKGKHLQPIKYRQFTPGRLLWKRMWLRLTYYFVEPSKKKEKRAYYLLRAQAIIRFWRKEDEKMGGNEKKRQKEKSSFL